MPSDSYSHPSPSVFYTASNIPGKGCDEQQFSEEFQGCPSECSCDQKSDCPCIARSGGKCNYTKEGTFTKLESHAPVHECHSHCGCSLSSCRNRLVQLGPRTGLVIQNEAPKGLALFTSESIPRGGFVCEYAGEVLGEQEAEDRMERQRENKEPNYVLMVRENVSNESPLKTIIDPTVFGNLGRYANHSCAPNIALHPVRSDTPVPHLALFALRNIAAGGELCFDYGDGATAATAAAAAPESSSLSKCFCGAAECRGFLPFNPKW